MLPAFTRPLGCNKIPLLSFSIWEAEYWRKTSDSEIVLVAHTLIGKVSEFGLLTPLATGGVGPLDLTRSAHDFGGSFETVGIGVAIVAAAEPSNSPTFRLGSKDGDDGFDEAAS